MPEREFYRWQIYLLRGEAQRLGVVEALDGVSAIEVAIEKFGIVGRDRHKLFVQRMDD